MGITSKPFNTSNSQGDIDYAKQQIKNIIDSEITYLGKPLRLIHYNNLDKCFDKLIVGGLSTHKTRKIDMARIQRVGWIYEIISHFQCCLINCNDCLGWEVFEENLPGKRKQHLIYSKQLYYVIVLIEDNKEWTIISAYKVAGNMRGKYSQLSNRLAKVR